jgi:hypothetical protein
MKNLIDCIPTNKAILMIDDIDHYFNLENINDKLVLSDDNTDNSENSRDNDNSNSNDNNDNSDDDMPRNHRRNKLFHSKQNDNTSSKKKYRPTIHELLSFFDGLNTKDGLIVIMCANDPSKIFKTNNIQDLALLRDQRINIICEFKMCDHNMIRGLYHSIFNIVPDEKLIKDIEENFYAPCTISKHFVSFYEKNSGMIDGKEEELNMLLEDLIFKRIQTNRELIMNYSKEYNDSNTIGNK